MKARRKGTKKIIEVEVLRPRIYRQKDKHGRVVEEFDEGELELLQELTQSTSDHWQDLRERAAIAAMRGVISAPLIEGVNPNPSVAEITDLAVKFADALVEKLKGE
jgi:hypothetical protein